MAAKGSPKEIEEFFRLKVMKHKTLYQGGPVSVARVRFPFWGLAAV